MKAKLKVIFEPSAINTSEVERKLNFIKELPIKAMLNNQGLNDLEMEVFFEKDKEVYIHPIKADNIYYMDLEKVKGCEIASNAYCTNIINCPTGKPSETYSFFYNKSK
jgi:hypothetical protein